MTSRILEWLKTEWERWGMKNYDRIEKFWVWHTEEESEVWNPIIIFGGWPKKKWGQEWILSSFLAGDQKRKLGQEFYHHSWRVTHKQFEVRNPIIIISKNKKVLAYTSPKRKWGQEFFHHSWRVTKKKVRSGILSSFLTVDPKSKWHLES